ncbi:hypothetical protein V6N13_083350 [Hibiscus sabdariffa]
MSQVVAIVLCSKFLGVISMLIDIKGREVIAGSSWNLEVDMEGQESHLPLTPALLAAVVPAAKEGLKQVRLVNVSSLSGESAAWLAKVGALRRILFRAWW